jgi:hypothetical protein
LRAACLPACLRAARRRAAAAAAAAALALHAREPAARRDRGARGDEDQARAAAA